MSVDKYAYSQPERTRQPGARFRARAPWWMNAGRRVLPLALVAAFFLRHAIAHFMPGV
jgi:hypothetical protein